MSACASQAYRSGMAAMERGDYETGMTDLSEAIARDPHNVRYRMDFATARESVVQGLVADAETARRANKPDDARKLYRRILALDPQNSRAVQGLAGLEGDQSRAAALEVARQDFERKAYNDAETKVGAILADDPGYVPAQKLAAAIKDARGPVTVVPRLKTRDNRRVTLQLRDAPTKMVFEVLERETGINFILDKDVKSDSKTSIFVQDVPVEEAIELVLNQSGLARQVLADNMVLVYPNIANKQKEYEQQIVRTIYLTNAAPKDVESMLKTVLGAKTMFVDERTSTVVIRDTPDNVRMAEKLVAALDVAEPEVMLEVEVLEISRSHVQDLGIQYPGSATFTALPSHTVSGLGATSGGLLLSDLKNLNADTIGVSSLAVTLNAMKTAGVATTLATPRIRVRNKDKAKVLIGSKEPVITNTTTPTAGGTAVVTGSVQYLDVGLQLEVQPTVYQDSDVGIKMSLEVSSILKQIQTASGTIAYEIGTRNANTMLRLKDGEMQVLAGLIQDTDSRTANTIPLLGDVPILSHLFGTHHTDKEKDEIVLSITPHIIRMQPRAASEATEFWYGTESHPGGAASAPAAAPSAAPPSAPPAGAPPAAVPGTAPFGLPGAAVPAATDASTASLAAPGAATGAGTAAVVGATAVGATAVGATAAMKSANASQGLPVTTPPVTVTGNQPGGNSALSLDGPNEVKVGDDFQVTVRLSTDQSITHLRSQLRFDTGALQLLSATPGDMVPAAAGNPQVQIHGGGAQLDVSTTSDSPVQGSGSLMLLQFKALGMHPATNIMAMMNVLGSAGAATGNSSAPPLKIAISQ